MTTTLIDGKKTNGTNALSTMDGETLSKLVLDGDLSKLDPGQKMAYYVYRCKAVGLDPATKPFDIINLQGKVTMYATKECAAQISQRDQLSVMIVDAKPITGDINQVQARVTDAKGRTTDDLGCVNTKGLTGDALCNAMLKATTKAKRRAILSHSGLGMLDETELETIPTQTTQTVPTPKKVYVLKPEIAVDPKGVGTPTDGSEDRVPASVTDAAAPVASEPIVVPDDGLEAVVLKAYSKEKTDKKGNAYRGVLLVHADNSEKWWNCYHAETISSLQSMKGQPINAKLEMKGEYPLCHKLEVMR
jgi:hypothetical protein